MEKSNLQTAEPPVNIPPQRHSKRTVRAIISAAILTSACAYFYGSHYPDTAVTPIEHVYREGNFTWKKCYDNFDCSTLSVPIDYHNLDNGHFNLALIRLKATQTKSKPLFVNPGGPGGSGISLVRSSGDVLSKALGGHYDIIGFDPRGIGESNTIRCFKDGTESKLFLANRNLVLNPGDNPAVFAASLEAYSNQCIDKNADFLPFVSTAAVARDIDSLRDAFGQELTNYWGFSYGTFLGATYVNMFPDRVGRVLLDGVTDPTTFSGELVNWIATSLIHTEEGVDKFGAACEAAGPEKCALAHPDKALAHEGPHYVAPTLRKFLKDLSYEPLVVRNVSSPEIVLQPAAAQLLFGALYKSSTWPTVAKAFATAIHEKDGHGIAQLTKEKAEGERCPLVEEYSLNAMPVLCIDGHHDDHNDLSSFLDGLDQARHVSPLAVPLWGTAMLQCLYWKVKAAERFTGPWNHATKNKVLLIGVTGDPVTPVESAQKLETLLEGSAIFHKHHGWGHCSLGHPSRCTTRVIHDYFVNGVVPEKGSECPMETEPFETPTSLFDNELSYQDLDRLADSLQKFT